jgi:hypothetical protein
MLEAQIAVISKATGRTIHQHEIDEAYKRFNLDIGESSDMGYESEDWINAKLGIDISDILDIYISNTLQIKCGQEQGNNVGDSNYRAYIVGSQREIAWEDYLLEQEGENKFSYLESQEQKIAERVLDDGSDLLFD